MSRVDGYIAGLHAAPIQLGSLAWLRGYIAGRLARRQWRLI